MSRELFSYDEEYFKRIFEAFVKPCGKVMTMNAHETSSDSASDAANASKKADDSPILKPKWPAIISDTVCMSVAAPGLAYRTRVRFPPTSQNNIFDTYDHRIRK